MATTARPDRVLLIDDDDMEKRLVEAHLAKWSEGTVGLDYASNVEDAAQLLADGTYRAIVLDNRLHPYRNYTETAPLLRDHMKDTHCIVISSVIDDPCFASIQEHFVDEVIDKFSLPARIRDGLFA